MIRLTMAAGILAAMAGAASASTFVFDFKKEAEATGQIGEAIFSTFTSSDNGVYVGPSLDVTATKSGDAAFVYFDARNAGMGVCGTPNNFNQVNQYAPGSSANRCDPGSDDGLTTTTETLHFTANENLRIESIYINSNHDAGSVFDTVWNIGGTEYDAADFVSESVSGTGDVRIDIDFLLLEGQSMTLAGVIGPNSYISAIAVAAVPVPAGMALMLTGLGGIAALRRRK